MNMTITVDVPEKELENIIEPLEPFEVKVSLDYGDKVIYVNGKIDKDTL